MRKINVHDAKIHLSRLLDATAAGEEIIITKAGKPSARLVPMAQPKRTPGAAKGKGRVTTKFFEPLPKRELG
jgi:prevent-host-death family protein